MSTLIEALESATQADLDQVVAQIAELSARIAGLRQVRTILEARLAARPEKPRPSGSPPPIERLAHLEKPGDSGSRVSPGTWAIVANQPYRGAGNDQWLVPAKASATSLVSV